MAKVYTGRDGRLLIDGTEQIKVSNWTLTGSLEVLETTTLGDSQRSYAPGVQEFNGSATLLYYRLEAGESVTLTQFTALLGKIQKVGAVTEADRVKLKLRVGAGGADDIEFFAYITSAQVGVSTGELVVVPIQFTVDGDFVAGGVIA